MSATATYTCPNCGREYEPEYDDPDDAPDGTIYAEQHISGLCSDDCWDEWLGEP